MTPTELTTKLRGIAQASREASGGATDGPWTAAEESHASQGKRKWSGFVRGKGAAFVCETHVGESAGELHPDARNIARNADPAHVEQTAALVDAGADMVDGLLRVRANLDGIGCDRGVCGDGVAEAIGEIDTLLARVGAVLEART